MHPQHALAALSVLVLAYLCGAIPSGLIFTRCFSRVDLLNSGSGNIGATNVRRTAGWRLGLLTLCADAAKGALPVGLVLQIPWAHAGLPAVLAPAAALAAFLGHLYPVYLKFSGGKGVATAAGSFAVLAPFGLLTALGVFALLLGLFRKVSAASMGASLVLPVAVWLAGAPIAYTACALCMSGLIVVRHRDNIHRLCRGDEPDV